jgi:hypothetical protein
MHFLAVHLLKFLPSSTCVERKREQQLPHLQRSAFQPHEGCNLPTSDAGRSKRLRKLY